jgi:hypothetical protein
MVAFLVCRLEKGDFKLRVRAMEVERQLQRSKLVEKNIFAAVMSGLFLNTGICLATVGKEVVFATPLSRAMFVAALALGLRVPYGITKVTSLDRYNERFGVKK